MRIGDLVFTPASPASLDATSPPAASTVLQLALPAAAPAPPTTVDQSLSAVIALQDGRTLTRSVHVDDPRPVITLLRKSSTATEPAPPATLSLGSPDDIPLSQRLTFTMKSADPFPRSGQIEIATLDGTLRAVLTLAPTGGLVLQDPHTLVATLDPLRAFGPSAFGPLQLRAVYPDIPAPRVHHEHTPPQMLSVDASGKETVTSFPDPAPGLGFSDWVPLGTLIRLPTFKDLTCPTEPDQPCILTGANLFLIQSLSTDAQFTTPTPVPDGFTGDTLQIPHATAGTLFFKLRDNPASTNSATLPQPPATPPPAVPVSTRKPKH